MPAPAASPPLRPRSQPRRFRQRQVPRRWRHLQRHRRERGAPWLSTRIRRVFWLWQPWALLTMWFLIDDRYYWAAGMLAMACVAFVLRPAETSAAPRVSITSMPAGSQAFLDTMAGLTGVGFLPGNAVTVLNNGDEFYPGDARGDPRRAGIGVHRAVHLLGRARPPSEFCEALAERARAGVAVKLLLDSVGSATLGERAYHGAHRGRVRSGVVQRRSAGTRSAASTTARTARRSWWMA